MMSPLRHWRVRQSTRAWPLPATNAGRHGFPGASKIVRVSGVFLRASSTCREQPSPRTLVDMGFHLPGPWPAPLQIATVFARHWRQKAQAVDQPLELI